MISSVGAISGAWAVWVVAMLSSAGTLALTWRCARTRGFNPVTALLLVGANPLYVIYALGGAHNDLLMMLLMMVAVSGARRMDAVSPPGWLTE